MRTALALSPHLDDATFSAGGTLHRLARRGWRVVIATIFTGNVERPTGFALACQLDKGISAEEDYMALRREEDAAACYVLGAKAVHLPHLEAPHRGYDSPGALFAGLREDDDVHLAAGRSVAALVDDLDPDLMLGPRGIGAHVDHLVVRRVLASASCPRRYAWTDWPYASKPDAPHPYRREDGRPFTLPTGGADAAAKLAACAAFRSQLGFQFGGEEGLARSLSTQPAETLVRL